MDDRRAADPAVASDAHLAGLSARAARAALSLAEEAGRVAACAARTGHAVIQAGVAAFTACATDGISLGRDTAALAALATVSLEESAAPTVAAILAGQPVAAVASVADVEAALAAGLPWRAVGTVAVEQAAILAWLIAVADMMRNTLPALMNGSVVNST